MPNANNATVADLIEDKLDLSPEILVNHPTLGEHVATFGSDIPVNSVCGRDCSEAVESFLTMMKCVAAAHGKTSGEYVETFKTVAPIIRSVCAVFCNG